VKYKEFVEWCNDRACDGQWCFEDALGCIDITKKVNKEWFWKREKLWQKIDSEYKISENILKNKLRRNIK
jgi:hypothetical protein